MLERSWWGWRFIRRREGLKYLMWRVRERVVLGDNSCIESIIFFLFMVRISYRY